MDVAGWCGTCGEPFRLVEVVEDGNGGRCPRCGHVFAPGYGVVLADSVRQLVAAAQALSGAAATLAEIGPGLHVDRTKLYADLDRVLGR